MARGNYGKKKDIDTLQTLDIQSKIPPRATRRLGEPAQDELKSDIYTINKRRTTSKVLSPSLTSFRTAQSVLSERRRPATFRRPISIVDEQLPQMLAKYKTWLPAIIAVVIAVLFVGVLLSAALSDRNGAPELVSYFGGKVYNVQVGGNMAGTWQSNNPMQPQMPITASGPYSVLGKPTINADFINRVLAAYHSPAAGKGQALYDLGVKYNIDPAFALAFFMHESGFGTAGEAQTTKSLGNLRCYPGATCVDQDRGGYASYSTWEAGFEAWYQLIRNYYVAQLGKTTID
ncbi:MAG TPA: glucosaminidase domain-containing protein, partial [Ktedonobacteraceae bacterium]